MSTFAHRLLPLAALSGCGYVHLMSVGDGNSPLGRAVPVVAYCDDLASLPVAEDQLVNSHLSTGVLAGPGVILTADHVVACADFPSLDVPGIGRAVVEREDRGRDVALLGTFERWPDEVAVAPPAVGEHACAATLGGLRCGTVTALSDAGRWRLSRGTIPGDSGAGVYDDQGQLLGVVLAGNGSATEFTAVDPTWVP